MGNKKGHGIPDYKIAAYQKAKRRERAEKKAIELGLSVDEAIAIEELEKKNQEILKAELKDNNAKDLPVHIKGAIRRKKISKVQPPKIITKNRRLSSKRNDSWLKRRCNNCTEFVYYKQDWTNPPTLCKRCRLLKISDLEWKLKKYLVHESIISGKIRTSVERSEFIKRSSMRQRINMILKSYKDDPKNIYKKILNDNEIYKLVLKLDKELRLTRNLKKKSHVLPKKIGKIFQGGAPGLGKR